MPLPLSARCAALLAALTLGLLPGPAAGQGLPEVAVERRLAEAYGLRVGDTMRVGTAPDAVTRTVRIAAIYEPKGDPSTLMRRDYHVRFHLPDLATLLGAPDRVDRFGVLLAPGVDPDSAAQGLNAEAFGYRAYPSARIAAESSRSFAVVSRFHKAIGAISIVASAIFLLCIMLLKVEERRKDAAVMRFVGVRRRTVFFALLLEACLVAIVGSVAGVVLAWVAGAVTNLYYQRLFETTLVFSLVTPGIVLLGVGLSLLLGVAAGAIAAGRLAQTRPLVLWGRG